MSEQGTEKTNPLHGLERDGTGTGVWTHPAAEAKQPEQPERCECECECGACVWDAGPMAWYWQPMQGKTLRRMHEYSHLRIYPNDCGFAHCPGECGCRLSVVDGEPRVGPSMRARVTELEAAVTTLEDRCDEYAAALNDSAELCDRLRAYYRRERRAVEMLAKHAAWHDAVPARCPPGREYGGPATEKRACTVAPTCAACWAAWAREEGGVKPDTERSE